MHRLFGRKKPEEAPKPAGPTLDEHVAKMSAKVPELDAKIAACDKELLGLKAQLARTPPARQGPLKQQALMVLKRRKTYETQRTSIQSRTFNLEQTQFAIDSVKGAAEHVAFMKAGLADMKAVQGTVDIGEVEDLHEDMADMLADAAEIDELMSRGYDTYDGVAEADLDAELAGLEADMAAEPAAELVAPSTYGAIPEAPAAAAAAAPASAFPAVPSTVPPPAASVTTASRY